MKNGLFFFLVLGMIYFLGSCATSMSPMKLNTTLPTLTDSKQVSKVEVEQNTQEDRCRYLVKGRKYAAPVGLTLRNDLKKGAQGIDEWVELDGGNAYSLVSYQWVKIDDAGSTQLHLEFDTMLCD